MFWIQINQYNLWIVSKQFNIRINYLMNTNITMIRLRKADQHNFLTIKLYNCCI